MPDNPRQLEFTSEFKCNIRTLVKRDRKIPQDVDPLLDRLQAGEILGDRVSGMGYEIYKVRLKNSDVWKGKSGVYRLIDYVKLPTAIVLVTIYSKSDRSDISAKKIAEIVKRHDNDRCSTGLLELRCNLIAYDTKIFVGRGRIAMTPLRDAPTPTVSEIHKLCLSP